MPSKKRATPISLQPLDALFGTNEETNNGICEIKIGSLHPFPNHPFQVKDDKKMEELSESITQYGVLVPGIVRLRESGGYELVAGHRRKRACELAGLEKMPVIIKGGVGMMYTCMIQGQESHLFYEVDKWFMERKTA